MKITVSDGTLKTEKTQRVLVADINDAPPIMYIGDLTIKTDAVKGDVIGDIGIVDPDG